MQARRESHKTEEALEEVFTHCQKFQQLSAIILKYEHLIKILRGKTSQLERIAGSPA